MFFYRLRPFDKLLFGSYFAYVDKIYIRRYEEYIDYLFPEESQTTNLKILEAAYKWKKQKRSSDED